MKIKVRIVDIIKEDIQVTGKWFIFGAGKKESGFCEWIIDTLVLEEADYEITII